MKHPHCLSSLRQSPRFGRSQKGQTLIELMIGITLGLVIMVVASAMYVSTVTAMRASEVESRLNENASIALNILQQQIRLAGYSQMVANSNYSVRQNFNSEGVRGCSGGFVTTTLAYPALIASSNCNNITTTKADALVVRYEGNFSNTVPTATSPTSPTNCFGNSIAATTVSDATSTAPSATVMVAYPLVENRFYIKKTGTPSGGPELYCTGLNGNTSTIPQSYPILEGVEEFQLSFGLGASSTATVTSAYMSAKDIEADATLAAQSDRWKRVIAVRVCLLMQSTDSSDATKNFNQNDTKVYYDCSNNQQTSSDGRLRRAYTTTVLLKNRLPVL